MTEFGSDIPIALAEVISDIKRRTLLEFLALVDDIQSRYLADKRDFDQLSQLLQTLYWACLYEHQDRWFAPFLPEVSDWCRTAKKVLSNKRSIQTPQELYRLKRTIARLEWQQSVYYRCAIAVALFGFLAWVLVLILCLAIEIPIPLRNWVAIAFPGIGTTLAFCWKSVDARY